MPGTAAPPGEFDLIDRHFARPTPGADLGPGDDCALVTPTPGMQLAATTDMLVAGTHFFADTDPEALGWKTLAVNVSDLAAMGATPRWALLAGALPAADEAWIAAFAKGFFACAGAFAVDVIGGDTTRGPLNLCVTALGEVPAGRALRRDGAKPGDDLWVSGRPGLANLGLRHLQGNLDLPTAPVAGEPPLRDACLAALTRPQPRVALGLALQRQGLAHAAIDVSDGLLQDLGHIARRSGLAATVWPERLPALPAGVDAAIARDAQLGGGDDYELVFAAPAAAREAIAALAHALDLPLTRFGVLSAPDEAPAGSVTALDEAGQPFPVARRGYDHFAA